MSKEYRTIGESGYGEYEEKKSRFLGEIHLVQSEEEAQELVAKARRKHYDARHHCYSYIIGVDGGSRRAADDGEPSGTAGVPMLKVLEGAGLANVIVIVTRYFGGTLLGTGGLVRAYTQAAKAALEKAQIVQMALCSHLEIVIEYSALDSVLYYLRQENLAPVDTQYTDKVTLTLVAKADRSEKLTAGIRKITNGSAVITDIGKEYEPIPIE